MKCKVNDKIWVEAKVCERHGVGVSEPVHAEFKNGHTMWLDEKDILTEQEIEAEKKEAHREGYDRGLEDAWELAKEIWCTYTGGQLEEIFGIMVAEEVMDEFTPQEATAKIKAYEEEIKVGDVLLSKNGDVCVVTRILSKECFYGMLKDGSSGAHKSKYYKKTGKRIDIQKILDEIGKERE